MNKFLLAAALLAAHAWSGAAAPVRPALEAFFENPGFSGALLSPTARYLAVRIGDKGVRDRLAVVDLSSNTVKVVGAFATADIGDFDWVNDERLVFNTRDKQAGQGETWFAPGLYAVNRDGSSFRQLITVDCNEVTEHTITRMLDCNHSLVRQSGKQDSNDVYVVRRMDKGSDNAYLRLLKLDTVTGATQSTSSPGSVQQWLLDHQGEPRLAFTLEGKTAAVHYREPGSGTWRQLGSFDGYLGGKGAFNPLAFAPDGKLYVVADNGKDKQALYTYDLDKGAINPSALIELDGFDFTGKLITDAKHLLGVRYLSDAQGTAWFDPAMKSLQAEIDVLLPNTVNLLGVAQRAQTPWVLVAAYSDVQPLLYLLYNTQTKKFNKVGDTYAAIDPATMASQEFIRYKARDGLEIPALLTVPHGSARKNLPLVMLVHGGPYTHGSAWGWHPETQFLASRGYAVLEPAFRGSMGYGAHLFRAGWKQWGLAMQNDVADGARWAIKEGIVDPKRICIAGASYGGYATLMGLVNDPDLYRCGIDWAGVTDINLMYTGHWSFASDVSEGWKQFGMPTLIGDPVRDAAQLKATSPIEQAARIRQPLLLAYGAADVRVPLYHGKKFLDAVKPGNPDIEWVVYEEEGHGWALPKNRIDFWGRVEKFLDRQIGQH
ncbi:MAG: prolyl oligopeptidase family serine peptidase [Pseudomonadota bacterium]